jgi:hypothetical protein
MNLRNKSKGKHLICATREQITSLLVLKATTRQEAKVTTRFEPNTLLMPERKSRGKKIECSSRPSHRFDRHLSGVFFCA